MASADHAVIGSSRRRSHSYPSLPVPDRHGTLTEEDCMNACRTWLAPQSGWLPGDTGPEWSGPIDMSGWSWKVGVERMPDGRLFFSMSSELARGRRRTTVEGAVPSSGASG